jgi:RNA polymerase sigma-70 factor (ECF subfamily)
VRLDYLNEQTAVRLCQRGDPAGLASLVLRQQAEALRVAALITRDPQLAEDVVADAFLTAFRRIHSFDAERPFRPWFLRVVTNTALKSLRSRRREIPWLATADHGSSTVPVPFGIAARAEESTAKDIATVDDHETVRWALRALPPKQRAAIILRYFADLNEGEIALALGIPRGTVKSRLSNGIARLRVKLVETWPS